jgi:hypothetical protein
MGCEAKDWKFDVLHFVMAGLGLLRRSRKRSHDPAIQRMVKKDWMAGSNARP